MPNTKQKSFRISEELAIEFEVHARKSQTKEVDRLNISGGQKSKIQR